MYDICDVRYFWTFGGYSPKIETRKYIQTRNSLVQDAQFGKDFVESRSSHRRNHSRLRLVKTSDGDREV